MNSKINSVVTIGLILIVGLVNAQSIESVVIGPQVWMVKNLDVRIFSNGDLIMEAKTTEEWSQAAKEHRPAWCYFNNLKSNGKLYGRLYNWYAVSDPRGLAPKGWHVPSDEEWTELKNQFGDWLTAGAALKSTSGWESQNGNGTNVAGFKGLPAGGRARNGAFFNIGLSGYWWSSSEANDTNSLNNKIWYNTRVIREDNDKGLGFSVRCIKNFEQPRK